jgi:hypothetical protein
MEAPSNGESSRKDQQPVGSTVTVAAAYRGRLYALENEIQVAMAKIWQLREQYLDNERKQMEALQQQRQRYAAEAQAAASAMGLPMGPSAEQKWDFNANDMTFTRTS